MEREFQDREREQAEMATFAALGAVLVGVGASLAYLLGKRRPGGGARGCPNDGTPTARLTIAADGSVTCDDIEVPLQSDNPNIRYFVRWCVSNRGTVGRSVDLENFKRDGRHVSALDHKHENRRPWKLRGHETDRPFTIQIAPEAIAELINSGQDKHEYEYDIWIDRERKLDPEIAIIRSR